MITPYLTLSINKFLTLGSANINVAEGIIDFPPSHVIIFYSFLVFFLVILNGFFVAAEFAIVKVRKSQIEELVDKGKKSALLSKKIVTNLDAYLSATQLGITFASIALGFVGEPFFHKLLDVFFHKSQWFKPPISNTISFFLSYSFVAYLHVVLGELMPKSLAIRKSLKTTLVISRFLDIFYTLFRPAIYVLNGSANWMLKHFFGVMPISESEIGHSAEELKILVDRSGKTQVVTETERDILLNALELNDLTVRDIMTPRNEVDCLYIEKSFSENMEIVIDNSHTRFPIVKGHLDEAVGQIHIKDMLNENRKKSKNIKKLIRKLEMVPEMLQLDKLLKFMLDKRAHLVLVVDEFGSAEGVVTLDNVLEELVGDINDEFETHKEEEFKKISEDEFLVKGSLAIFELTELTGLNGFDEYDFSTIGGYITQRFGHLPKKGEKINIKSYEVTVESSNGKKIIDMRFKKIHKDEEKSESEDTETSDDIKEETVD